MRLFLLIGKMAGRCWQMASAAMPKLAVVGQKLIVKAIRRGGKHREGVERRRRRILAVTVRQRQRESGGGASNGAEE